jgi:MinD-like ATPase involved in chromosome partitioning or flagellar assembly
MLDFARRHYRVVLADLSGNMERYSLEVMRESKQIFLVCSPELSSVHLARKKFHYLRNQGLGDRVCLLLNRAESDSMVAAAEIEEIVELPVFFAFPNDYRGVLNAVFKGEPVDRSSALGQQFDAMAHLLMGGLPKPAETGRGLAEKLTGWLSSRPWKSLALPARRP